MALGSAQQGRALSLRQLTFIFFGLVALCAVFFALGFLTGTNHRSGAAAPEAEQVLPPSVVPPPVNAPTEDTASASSSKPQGSTVVEQDLKQPPQEPASETPAPASTAPRASSAVGQPGSSQRAPLTETPAPAVTRSIQRSQGGIMVQVAALRTQQDARSLLAVLESRRYHAVVVTPEEARQGDNLYRVQVGPFESRADALKTLHKLGGEGFRPFIRE